jgi:hypothetical protein
VVVVHDADRDAADPRLSDFPRPLTTRERDSLLKLLPDGGFDGAGAYRAQLEHATAVAPCSCPCASIEIEIDREAAPPSLNETSLLPISAVHEVPNDPEQETYWLMAWSENGYLSSLEIAWLNEPPGELPPVDVWRLEHEMTSPGGRRAQ